MGRCHLLFLSKRYIYNICNIYNIIYIYILIISIYIIYYIYIYYIYSFVGRISTYRLAVKLLNLLDMQ